MTKRIIAVMLSVLMLVSCCAMSVGAVLVSGTDFTATLAGVDAYMAAKTPAQRQTIYDFLEVYTSTDPGMDTLIALVDDQSEVSQLIRDYIQAYGVSADAKQALKMYLTLLKCVPVNVRRNAVENWHDRIGYAGYDALASYAAGTAAIRGYLLGGSTYEADGITDAVFYQLLYNLRDMFVFTADANDANYDYEFYGFTSEAFKNNIENILIPEFAEVNGTPVVCAEHFMMLFCDIINADTNITPQMKIDFANTLRTTNSFVDGTAVTSLTLSTTDPTTQKIGALANVNVTLTAVKTDDTAAGIVPAVEWYVNGELKQYTGDSFIFRPSAVGTYEITAVSGGVVSNVLTVQINPQGTIVEDTTQPGTDSDSSNTGVTEGITGGTQSGTVPPAQPNKYPEIPAPSQVGFVTMNNSTSAIPNETVSFDDIQGHWAQAYIELLATAGFLRGHSATEYAPDFGVTREEMAVILVRVLGIEGQKAANPIPFSDHSDIQDYAVDAVYKLVELGVYKGHSEGHFAPQQILTREEISALFSRVLGKAGLTTDVTFTDHHEIADWFEADVENLVNYGVVNGYPDESFRPHDDVTRGEAAVMLFKTLYRLGILK